MSVHILIATEFVVDAREDAVLLTRDLGLAAKFETPERAQAFLAERAPTLIRWWREHPATRPNFIDAIAAGRLDARFTC
jgi:hypothetical protein